MHQAPSQGGVGPGALVDTEKRPPHHLSGGGRRMDNRDDNRDPGVLAELLPLNPLDPPTQSSIRISFLLMG